MENLLFFQDRIKLASVRIEFENESYNFFYRSHAEGRKNKCYFRKNILVCCCKFYILEKYIFLTLFFSVPHVYKPYDGRMDCRESGHNVERVRGVQEPPKARYHCLAWRGIVGRGYVEPKSSTDRLLQPTKLSSHYFRHKESG